MKSLIVAIVFLQASVMAFGADAANPHPGSAPVNIVAPLPLPVTVSGPTEVSGTVQVRDVDNPARQPFQSTLCVATSGGGAQMPSCGDNPDRLVVAGDRRLVIEYVSAECFIPGIDTFRIALVTTAGGITAIHYQHYVPDLLDPRLFDYAHQTRIYADPGTEVGLNSASSAGASAHSLRCNVTLSGYSVAP